MNALDIGIALVLAVATIYGLVRGFVHIALGIAGFGIGLAAALKFADRGPRWFPGTFANPNTARFVAFALIFVGVLIVTALVIWLGGKLVRAAGIGWVDRLAGGIVGLGGGMLAVVGIALALTTFLPPGAGVLRHSKLMPMVLGGVDIASFILPHDLADAFHERRAALAGETQPAPSPAAPNAPAPPAAPATRRNTT